MTTSAAPSGSLSPAARTLRTVVAMAAVTPFVVVPGFLFPFVVPRTAWFRVLVAAGTLLLAWLWARGKWRPAPGRWRRERVGLALAGYAAIMVAAGALGSHPLQGLLGSLTRMGGAVAWLHYLLFFLLLRAVLDEEGWLTFLKLIAVVGVAVTAWGLLQAYGAGLFGIAIFGWDQGRVVGPVGLEGPLAAYLLLSAAIAGHLATRAGSTLSRAGWGTIVAVELWTVVLTGTRAALVAGVVAALAVGVWVLVTRTRRGQIVRLVAGGGALAILAVVGLALVGERSAYGIGRMLDLGPDALASRLPLWRAAWAGFLEHPLLGVGPESLDLAFDHAMRAGDYLAAGAAHHDRAHNVLLGTLAESGVAGLLACLAFWTAVLAAAWRALDRSGGEPGLRWLAGGVVAYLVYLMFWFENVASFHLLLVVVAFLEHRRLAGEPAVRDGGAPTGGADPGTDPGAGASRPPALRGALAVSVAALLVVGTGWHQAQVLGASKATWEAMSAREPLAPFRHLDRALAYPLTGEEQIVSRYVVMLDGLAGIFERGQVDLDPDRMGKAFRRGEEAVRRQMRREPRNSVVHARLATLHGARWRWSGDSADFRRAVQSYRRALELSPGRVRYLHHLARLHSRRGDPERAMEVLGEALDRLPGWWETYNTMAQVQWDAGNREEAVRWLFRAARTEVRRKTVGTSSQFMVRAGSWLEARGTPMQAVELFEAYLGTRYPGWTHPSGRRIGDVPGDALPIAARLPITLLHTGRVEEARRAALRLLERLPPHLRRPVVTDRLERFIDDMAAGRTGPWLDRWGVLPTDVPLGG